MKTSLAVLAVLVLPVLAAAPASGDPAGARAQLDKKGIAVSSEAFLEAVSRGDAGQVALFLEAGIDPSVKNAANQTALWIAVEQHRLDVVRALLKGGAAPDAKNAPPGDYGKTIVFAAVDTGDAALVDTLAAAGAPVDTANEYGVTPLSESARTGNMDLCKVLLKAGADPNAAPGGFHLLYGPVNEGHVEVVRLLLSSGAKLGEHRQGLVEAAREPEMRALLEAAE